MTLAVAEAQAQVSTDWRSVSVFNAISSRQHITLKMQSVVRVLFVLMCILVAGIVGQDVKPELPEYLPPPTTTQEVITEAPTTPEAPTTVANEETTVEVTTVPTEILTNPPTEQATTIPTTPAEVTTISTPEPTTTRSTTGAPTTISTTEPITTTSTTEPTTTTFTTELTTTTSTTEPTTTTPTTTTQSDPIHPTSLPPSVRPTTSRRPFYTTKNPWSWNELEPTEQCYLKDQHEYIKNCWGYGWTSSFTCYRCCYYPNSNFAGCSRLHRGRCWWFD